MFNNLKTETNREGEMLPMWDDVSGGIYCDKCLNCSDSPMRIWLEITSRNSFKVIGCQHCQRALYLLRTELA